MLGCLLGFPSCKDQSKNIIPAEFDTIIGFKNAGKKTVNLYKTGADTSFSLTILKGGTNTNSTPKASLEVMSAGELEEYGALLGVKYHLLPSSMYEISETGVDFKSNEQYLNRTITFKTNDILPYLETTSDVVLPVRLVSSTDSVNADNNLFFLSMNVLVPTISFYNFEDTHTLQLNEGDESKSIDIAASLPFDSEWDFDVALVVDQDKVNTSKYLPLDFVSLSKGGKVAFSTGNKRSSFVTATVNATKILGPGIIPVKMDSSSLDFMELDNRTYQITVNSDVNKVSLTADQLSTNAQEPLEGPIQNAIDGNPNTFFHTAWSVAINEPHYFQVHLKSSISTFRFGYTGRAGNNAGDIQRTNVEVSNDGNVWKSLEEVTFELEPGAGVTYYSSYLTTENPISYIRITPLVCRGNRVLASGNRFFNFAEFILFAR